MNRRYFPGFTPIILLGIIFLFITCSEENNPVAEQEEHFEAEGLLIYNKAGNILLDYFQAVSDDTLFVSLNGTTSILQIKFYDKDKNEIDAPYDDNDHTLGWVIDDESILELVRVTNDEWKIQLQGLTAGETNIEFQVLHVGHSDFRTIKIPVIVE